MTVLLDKVFTIERYVTCSYVLTDSHFFERMLFMNESSFSSCSILDRQNARIWTCRNPDAMDERFNQGRSTINVWAGIVANCITAPMFLPTSMKSATYLRFLRPRLLIELREIMHLFCECWQSRWQVTIVQPVIERIVWIGYRSALNARPRCSWNLMALNILLWEKKLSTVRSNRLRSLNGYNVRSNAVFIPQNWYVILMKNS